MNNFRVLIPVLFILLIGISACQSSKDISKEEAYSPCTDKLYLELQKRDSTTYSDFEKKYFNQKSEECRNALTNAIKKKEHDEKQAVGEKGVLVFVIAGATVVLGLLLFGLAGKSD